MPPRKPLPAVCIGERNIPQRRSKDGNVFWVDKTCNVWEILEESGGSQEHKYWAMVCPSNMSTCRQCGKPIEKGSVRLGKPRKGSKGAGCPTGWYTTWFHVECCRAANDNGGAALTAKTLKPLIFANHGQLGTTAVTPKQLKDVLAELLKAEQPECLKSVDPTDDDFMQLEKQLALPKAKLPPGLQGQLLPFQAQGLGWMAAQEKSEFKGGILADEMGLGKTIQTIALLLEAKQRAAGASVPKRKSRAKGRKSAPEGQCLPCTPGETDIPSGPTLIIMPTSALHQWSEEITTFAGDSLRVLVYYGKKDRSTTPSELLNYDVILTTYPVAEIEWRLQENKTKVQCKYCNRYFTEQKLRDHNKYWCGPNAKRTAKQRKTDKKGVKDGDGSTTQSVNLGGHAFLDSVAAPDASLSAAAAKRNARGARGGSTKRKKASEVAAAATDPSGITDIYRGIMHSAGREAPGRWERINKARAQAQRRDQNGGGNETDDEEEADGDEPEAEIEELSEAEEQEPELISAAGDVSVGEVIEVREEPAHSEAWYAAKVLSSSSKGVKVHYVGWKSSYDELIRPSTGRLRKKLDETAAAKPGVVAKTALRQGKRNVRAKAVKQEQTELLETTVAISQQKQKKRPTKTTAADTKTRAAKGKGGKKATTKARKRKKLNDDDEEWEVPVKKESSETSTRGRKRKTVSYAESGSDSDSDSDASSAGDEESSSDEDYDAEATEEEFVKPTLPDGTPLPTEWDGIDLSDSKLHSTVWARVILDEAHKIKGRTTNVAKAIYSLRASYRWCLSGTPLQNNVGELYGLVKFLKMDPWAYYCCNMKGCDCKFMWWQFVRGAEGKKCAACGHRSFMHFSYFNRNIIKPISNNGFTGTGRDAMLRIRNEVLQKIQLRRTKVIVQKDINLPPLTVRIVKLKLSTDEKDFYEAIYKQSKLKFDSFGAKGTVLNNYAHIFDMLGRLRQACDHPYLIVHGNRHGQAAQLPGKTSKRPDRAGALCGICQDLVTEEDVEIAKCKHVFHNSCITDYVTGISMDNDDPVHAEDDTAGTSGKAKRGKALKKTKSAPAATAPKEIKKNKKPMQPGCPVCFKPLTITLADPNAPKSEEQIRKDAVAAAASADGGQDKPKTQRASGTKKPKTKEPEQVNPSSDSESEDEEAELQRALLMSMEADSLTVSGSKDGNQPAGGDDDDSSDEGASLPATAVPSRRQRRPSSGNKGGVGSLASSSALKIGRSNFLHRIDLAEFTSSSKLNALIDAIVKVKKKSPDHKSIVFSQYVNFLDIIEWRLKTLGFSPVKLVGSASAGQRSAMLHAFKTNPEVEIILLSLRAGGEGLNLQCASHVFLLDPWWNPAVEMQAIQRAHRIGQTRAVEAIRFCTTDSIEDNMMALQAKKQLVFEGVADGKFSAMASKLSQKDLQFLFRN